MSQAWHLVTSTSLLRGTVLACGRRGTHGTGLALVARLVARDTAALCVAAVAFGDLCVRFEFCLAGVTCGDIDGGTHGTGLALVAPLVVQDAVALCVAGVTLGDMCVPIVWQVAFGNIDGSFVWQAWRSRRWAGSGGALGPSWPLFRGVACDDIDFDGAFVWQAWHSRHWAGSGGAIARVCLWGVTSTLLLCGRRGAW